MWDFLQAQRFDSLSFCTGVLAGILFFLIFQKIRLALQTRPDSQPVEIQPQEPVSRQPDLIHLKNDTLLFAQGWHVAAGLFPLDEIIVEPRLLAPPPAPAATSETWEEVTDWVIPYMPDWPEMGSRLGSPTLSLAEAMAGGCNLAVTGEAGAGKSVALAHLATQLIRNSTGVQEFENITPVLVRAGDLDLPGNESGNLLAPLQRAMQGTVSAGTKKNLPSVLLTLFEEAHAILIVDGLDCLPPSQLPPLVEYLGQIRKQYPRCRMAASVSLENLDGLLALDFYPFALACWDQRRRLEFTRGWSAAWSKYSAGGKELPKPAADQWMLQGWLANEITPHTPLEMALRCWAAFAGDALGAKPYAALEAHFRRLICHLPTRSRRAVENLALEMVRNMQPVVLRKDADAWLSASQATVQKRSGDIGQTDVTPAFHPEKAMDDRPAPDFLPALVECGLLEQFSEDRVGISQPAFLGYLAGEALLRGGNASQLLLQPEWSGKSQTLRRFYSQVEDTRVIEGILKPESADILIHSLLTTARWLKDAPENVAWVRMLMSRLAASVQGDKLSFNLKARALNALVLSGYASVRVFVQQLLDSNREDLQQLGILGSGMLRNAQPVQKIQGFLSSRSSFLRSAAALSLVAINDQSCMDALANGLLHGDETLRRACAEALSNDPEEGFPTLQEGCAYPDPLVRRSVIYGLRRIKRDWVKRSLVEMRDNDAQWIVKDAASQALVQMEKTDARIPQPVPEPTLAPWLIAFAAEKNMVVPPGRAAVDLVHRCLKEGNEEQVLSAVHFLGFRGEEASVAPLYQVYLKGNGERREMAVEALQRLASSGVALPPPTYFGMA